MFQIFADVILIAAGQYDRRRREWDRPAGAKPTTMVGRRSEMRTAGRHEV